jgi:hypothetical protein
MNTDLKSRQRDNNFADHRACLQGWLEGDIVVALRSDGRAR